MRERDSLGGDFFVRNLSGAAIVKPHATKYEYYEGNKAVIQKQKREPEGSLFDVNN